MHSPKILPALKTTLLKKFKLFLVAFFACLGLNINANENSIVEAIVFDVSGDQQIDDNAAKAYIPLKEGMPYSTVLIDQSIRSLYSSGAYDSIEVIKQTDPSGQRTWITFVLVTRSWVNEVQFEGNSSFTARQLQRNIKTKPGILLDELQLKQDIESLSDFYNKKGYAYAKIDYEITKIPVDDKTLTNIVFTVQEGSKLKLGDIQFSGNDHIKSKNLKTQMTLETYGFFSWLTGSGVFEESVLEQDCEAIEDYYRNHGYLDVNIPRENIERQYLKPNQLMLVIPIKEGQCYHLGKVEFSGNTLYTADQLENALYLRRGAPYSPDGLEASVQSIRDYYGQAGYLEVGIDVQRIPNVAEATVDLLVTIEESGKFYVESILLEGNTKTKSNVILRELALAPGDLFDSVRMQVSESRLKQTLFFEEVTLSPEPVSIPNHKNLRVTVKEKSTGQIQFGVGFSTVERAVAFVELTQSNFDLFNKSGGFQGGGQKFRTRVSVGNKSNLILMSLEEPALFDKQLAVGVDLLRADAKYVSSVYDELRYSAEFYARKRLFELFVLRPYYKIEVIDIHNVRPTASPTIREHAGNNVVSQVGVALVRETIDSLLMPTEGSRLKFAVDVAGLGGNIHFVRGEVQAGKWWPTFRTLNQVFSLVGRTGTIAPFAHDKVPFFETYYLGGPDNLRGYSYRDVGPKDAFGESIGGNTYAFAAAEYSFQILDPVRFAAFYDIGFVNAGTANWSTKNYAHDIGVGLRILLAGAPIRIDLARPLRVDPGQSRGWEFNLSFGTVF